MPITRFPLIVLALSAFSIGSAAGNLVTNGSFESGFTGWTALYATSGSDMIVTTDEALDGTHSLRFMATDSYYDSVAQTLTTVAGQDYVLSLWVKNYGVDMDSLVVNWGNTIPIQFDPVGTALESWQLVSATVTATTDSTYLRINGRDAQASFYVDDVQVQAVPEPATLAVMGFGALALARRRRQGK